MEIIAPLILAVLLLVVFSQIIRPLFIARYARAIFFGFIFWISSVLIFISCAQYLAWVGGAPTKYLLPPYQSIGYFFIYIWWRFWAPYVLSLAIAIAIFYLAKWYNRRHNNSFFYDEELYYLATGVFLVGHPLWIFYFISAVIFASVAISFRSFVLGRKEKFSLYYFWLPTAAFVIIISKWLSILPLYLAAKF